MPERQISGKPLTDRWVGTDQRTQPTIVSGGFVTWSKGVAWGVDGEVQRITGKRTKLKLTDAALNIFQLNKIAIVQGLNTVYIVPVSELTT
jgi:hypothetical protein